jgi:eukaryotic-like serine/threonine-protein kinase
MKPSGGENQLHPGVALANRYLIQGVLGVGGMGAVYRARDLHFPNVEKRVAVKEMVNKARDTAIRDMIVRNFEREANILATLSHPAIPRIYDYFTQDERSYLILEFIDGKDLEALLNDTEEFFSETQVITWAVELCDVLHYLHNHQPEPIVFRDIKPSNIMINQNGHVVVIDFGIAKPFESSSKGTMIGTEGYSPPEQYRGEATQLVDIYALGATLHHILTRRDPRLEAPFSFSERPIRKINPTISIELETIINTAISYAPEARFQSAMEMKEALLGAARSTGILPNLRLQQDRQGTHTTKLLWKFECEDEVRGSLTCAKSVVYCGSYDNNLYALNADTGEFIWKYASAGGIVSRPAIYDNTLFVGSEDNRLHVINPRTGKIAWSYATEGPVRSSPYGADGHIFIGSDDGYIHAVNVVNARRIWKIDCGAPIRSTPILSNGLLMFGTEAGDFLTLELTGNFKWRFKAKRAITGSAVVDRGVVFFTSVDATLYALDANSGWVLWRYRLGKASISTPCLAEDYIFTGAADGDIYCIDVRSAKEVWRFKTEHQVTGSPLIHNDALYCGSVDGHLYCLEYRTGRLRWKYRTDGPITGTPAANNNIIYIGSTDHNIYALSA